MTRDPGRFDAIVEGRRGIGLLQDLPHRMRMLLTGQPFDPSHSALDRSSR
jgi:hypothetical protein